MCDLCFMYFIDYVIVCMFICCERAPTEGEL